MNTVILMIITVMMMIFDTVFGQIAESMGLDYAIDSDHVFDSPGCDIYCKAIAVANADCLDNALLTFTHC